jgi:hypothetical protein
LDYLPAPTFKTAAHAAFLQLDENVRRSVQVAFGTANPGDDGGVVKPGLGHFEGLGRLFDPGLSDAVGEVVTLT